MEFIDGKKSRNYAVGLALAIVTSLLISLAVQAKPKLTTESVVIGSEQDEPVGYGFMNANVFGYPFATDRDQDPVVGIGYWGETGGRNSAVGIRFRAPTDGNFAAFRTVIADDTSHDAGYGYAGGTGGKLVISLMATDSIGNPKGSPLDQIVWTPNLVKGQSCIIGDNCAYQYNWTRRFEWPKSPAIKRNQVYVVTFENTDPDPKSNFVRLQFLDFSDEPTVTPGGSYLGGGDLVSSLDWGTIIKYDSGPWFDGRLWPTGTKPSGYQPLPVATFLLADGRSFGQGGWIVGTDHPNYHGPGPLGSGCSQTGAASSFRCDVQNGYVVGQDFTLKRSFSTGLLLLPVVPFEGGDLRVSLTRQGDAVELASCKITIPTLDQTAANPAYGLIRSRQFSCSFPTVNLVQSVPYSLRISAVGSTKAAMLVVGDGTVWPFSHGGPFADMPGAGVPGHFVTPDEVSNDFYDLQFGLVNSAVQAGLLARQAAPTTIASPDLPPSSAPARSTTTTKPKSVAKSLVASCQGFVKKLSAASVTSLTEQATWDGGGTAQKMIDGDACANSSRWISRFTGSEAEVVTIRLTRPAATKTISLMFDQQTTPRQYVLWTSPNCTGAWRRVGDQDSTMTVRTVAAEPAGRNNVIRTHRYPSRMTACIRLDLKKRSVLATAWGVGYSVQEVDVE